MNVVAVLAVVASCRPTSSSDTKPAPNLGSIQGTGDSKLSANLGSIRGQVRDAATGKELAGVTVTAMKPVVYNGTATTAITDKDGFYAIRDLEPGDYEVHFFCRKTDVERKGVVVRAGQTTPVFETQYVIDGEEQ